MSQEGRDFLVTYASTDREWALWIAVELQRAGYTTVTRALDLRSGSDVVHPGPRAASQASGTIAVLSPAAVESRLGEAEWNAVSFRGPSGAQGLLVPLRVAECEPSGAFGGHECVDLIGLDENAARAALLRGVAAAQPLAAPVPGEPLGDANAVEPAPRFPAAGPAISGLPDRNPRFTGRAALLDRLHNRLRQAAAVVLLPVEAVRGLGGVGKTQLAVEYAHRYRGDYDLVWWISAGHPATAVAGLAALAQRLGVADVTDQRAAVSELFEQLRHRERWLLVYDDAGEPASLAGLLPPEGTGSVVLTSRWTAWGRQAQPLRVDVFDRVDSVHFLARRTGRTDTDTAAGHLDPARVEGFGRLAELVGDLPLALNTAAAYLEQTAIDARTFGELLTAPAHDLLGSTTPVVGGQSDIRQTAALWSLSLDRAHVEAPAAEALLTVCAFLGSDIPRSLLSRDPDAQAEPVAEVVADPAEVDATLAVLGRYGLVEPRPETIGLHRLAQTVLRARLRHQRREARQATTAVDLVRAAYPDEAWEAARWPECARLLPPLLAVCEHAERLAVAGEQAGWLLDRASTYLRGRGLSRQARPLAERALALTRTALGPEHVETGRRHDELGRVLQDLGDLDGARAQYESAVRIGEAALGADHPDIGHWRSGLADLLQDLGDLTGARAQYESALRISEAALGADHPDVGIQRGNLGTVLHDLGDLPGARTQLERALRITENAFAQDHPDVAVWSNDLGNVLHDEGDLAAARAHLERALRISEADLGADHPQSRMIRTNLERVPQDDVPEEADAAAETAASTTGTTEP